MQETKIKLNKYEQYKNRMTPCDFLPLLQTLDFDNLSDADRFYLENFGIINLGFAEDEFTIRLKMIAGRLSAKEFQAITDIVKRYNLKIILTARAGIQLHGLDADNILVVFNEINSLNNITSWQSISDNIRTIITDVYDGITKDNIIEVFPLIEQMQAYIEKNPNFIGMLPRRISVGISGNFFNTISLFSNDIYFALAKKNEDYGFNVYLGGKNSEVAKDADIFLLKDEVLSFFKAFFKAFLIYGYRGTRSKTRLASLLERIGMSKFKEYIQIGYNQSFTQAGKLQIKKKKFYTYKRLRDKTYSFCYKTDFGRLSLEEMQKICDFTIKNDLQLRISIDQNLYLVGLSQQNVPFFEPKHNANVIACAGSEYCPFSFWNIKDECYSFLPLEKIEKNSIKIGFSGCTKGCGRHRHSDIGLLGLRTNNFGDTQGGARVFLGARYSYGECVARDIFSMVPFEHLKSLITLIIELYEKSEYEDFEQYSHEVLNNFSYDFLAFWYLCNLYTSQTITLPAIINGNFSSEKELIVKYFKDIKFFELVEDNFAHAISIMSKSMWTIQGNPTSFTPTIKRKVTR